MARYRNGLPQLLGNVFVTDGGIETTLIFHDGLELPDFAVFDLLKNDDGNPVELGHQYRNLKSRLTHLSVVGGCCGTDHRHIEEICKAIKTQPMTNAA